MNEDIVRKVNDIYTCHICERTAFPPVRWNIDNIVRHDVPKCSHVYCINCTRRYFQLDKRVSDRTPVRLECLVCQQRLRQGSCVNGHPKNAFDVYCHCNQDEYELVKTLVELEGEPRKCVYESCTFHTYDPYLMKQHNRNECLYSKINCKNKMFGCHFMSDRANMSDHTKECVYEQIYCQLCESYCIKKDIKYHLLNYHKIKQYEHYESFISLT